MLVFFAYVVTRVISCHRDLLGESDSILPVMVRNVETNRLEMRTFCFGMSWHGYRGEWKFCTHDSISNGLIRIAFRILSILSRVENNRKIYDLVKAASFIV